MSHTASGGPAREQSRTTGKGGARALTLSLKDALSGLRPSPEKPCWWPFDTLAGGAGSPRSPLLSEQRRLCGWLGQGSHGG